MKNHWLKKNSQNNSGFPSNDALALQQLATGNCLDVWYDLQFVQNEVLTPIFQCEKRDNLTLDHIAVAGTMTGIVYLEAKAIQTFVIMTNGIALFQDFYKSKTKVTSIQLNQHTGETSFLWNEVPGNHNYVVSYEYNIECQYDPDQ